MSGVHATHDPHIQHRHRGTFHTTAAAQGSAGKRMVVQGSAVAALTARSCVFCKIAVNTWTRPALVSCPPAVGLAVASAVAFAGAGAAAALVDAPVDGASAAAGAAAGVACVAQAVTQGWAPVSALVQQHARCKCAPVHATRPRYMCITTRAVANDVPRRPRPVTWAPVAQRHWHGCGQRHTLVVDAVDVSVVTSSSSSESVSSSLSSPAVAAARLYSMNAPTATATAPTARETLAVVESTGMVTTGADALHAGLRYSTQQQRQMDSVSGGHASR